MGNCLASPTKPPATGRPAPPPDPPLPPQPRTDSPASTANTPAGSSGVNTSSRPTLVNAAAGSSGSISRGVFRRLSLNSRRRSYADSMPLKPTPNALRVYATLPSPSISLPASTLLTTTPHTIAIFDAYPKAKYHFLILPRHPFAPQANPDDPRSIIKLEHLDDLKSLLLKPTREAREEVIRAMSETAREVEEMVRDEMNKTEGFEWKIHVGFHAIPSMKHVHLHVISEDRMSVAMKTKKHHNSFRPDLGFFIPIMEVERWIQQDDASIRERVEALSAAGSLLEHPLTCFKCDEPFHNIPKLKAHLEKEFESEKRRALDQIRRHGRQRSSDDDDELF